MVGTAGSPAADGPGRTARCNKMDATPESDAADVGFDGGQSQDHTRAFCPADSMHEVRGCEARSQCQEKEQGMSRAAEMSKIQ